MHEILEMERATGIDQFKTYARFAEKTQGIKNAVRQTAEGTSRTRQASGRVRGSRERQYAL